MKKFHEWEESKSGIRKHYRKILYPTMGVALVGATTTAVVLPIMIKKIAEEKFAQILPIGGPVNSLKDSESIQAKQGKVNYVAIGDSITAGYNGYLNSNDVVSDRIRNEEDKVGTPSNTKSILEEIDNLQTEIDQLSKDLQAHPGDAIIEQKIKHKKDVQTFLKNQLGDFSSHSTKDYLSYADYVANDLAKANKLNDYRNFALSGATIPNLRQTVLRNTTALAALQNADLISLSIGANDLLAAVEVLRLSFNAVRGNADTDKVSQFNAARNAIEAITKVNEASHEPDEEAGNHRATSPSAYASDRDTKNLIKKSFYKFVNMLESGSLAGLIDIEQELLNNIFDLIQLDAATAINEIHKAAPDAKIILMGYGFPFHLLPDSIINSPIVSYDETKFSTSTTAKTVDGQQKTLKEVFLTLVDKLRATVEKANYVKFFNINDLTEFSDKSVKVTYKLEGSIDPITEPEWDRVMPNPLDIHPSTYGHQVIAGHLYEWIARDLGLNVPNFESVQKLPTSDSRISELEKIYTYAGVDKGFDIHDEDQDFRSPRLLRMLDNVLGQAPILKAIAPILKTFINPDKAVEQYDAIKNIYSDDSKTIFEKIKEIFTIVPKMVNVDEKFGNIQGYTVGKFVQALADLYNKYDFSGVPMFEAKLPANPTVGQIVTIGNSKYTYAAADASVTEWGFETKDGNVAGKGTKPAGWVRDLPTNIEYPDPAHPGKTIKKEVSLVWDTTRTLYGKEGGSKFYKEVPGASDLIPNIATDAYGINGIKVVESLLGILIYVSSSKDFIGQIDRSQDPLYENFKTILVPLLNVMNDPSKSQDSISNLLTFAMMSPIAGGGVLLQNGKDVGNDLPGFAKEIVDAAKDLGMDISSVVPTTGIEDWVLDTLMSTVNPNDPSQPGKPILEQALNHIGIK